jgi:hypothetical protein
VVKAKSKRLWRNGHYNLKIRTTNATFNAVEITAKRGQQIRLTQVTENANRELRRIQEQLFAKTGKKEAIEKRFKDAEDALSDLQKQHLTFAEFRARCLHQGDKLRPQMEVDHAKWLQHTDIAYTTEEQWT